MTTRDIAVPLAGYSDRLSLRPGETIGFKVSSTLGGPLTARLTRSISADPNPEGPGIIERSAGEFFAERSFAGRYQSFHPGSYALTGKALALVPEDGFRLSATVYPGLSSAAPQAVLGIGDNTLANKAHRHRLAVIGEALDGKGEQHGARNWP